MFQQIKRTKKQQIKRTKIGRKQEIFINLVCDRQKSLN